MLHSSLAIFLRRLKPGKRYFHNSNVLSKKQENPILRTLRILNNDLKMITMSKSEQTNVLNNIFPHYVDVVVIGGAAVGSSIAYFLKEKTGLNGLKIAVIEKDPTVNIFILSFDNISCKLFSFLVFKMLHCVICGWLTAAVFFTRKHSNVFIRC